MSRGHQPDICNEDGKILTQIDMSSSSRRIPIKEKGPFICDECGKRLSRKHHLIDHRRIHTGEKPFICKICGKGFGRQFSLRLHERTHTGKKPYKCTECVRTFNQVGHLRKHMEQHMESPTHVESYTCNDCGKQYARKCNLSWHMEVHRIEMNSFIARRAQDGGHSGESEDYKGDVELMYLKEEEPEEEYPSLRGYRMEQDKKDPLCLNIENANNNTSVDQSLLKKEVEFSECFIKEEDNPSSPQAQEMID